MTFYAARNLSPTDQLLFDAAGNCVGIQPGGASTPAIFGQTATEKAATTALVSTPWNAVWRLGGMSAATVSTTTSDRGLKVEAEAPFSRVRLRLYSEGGAATNFQALAAVTETASISSAAELSQPVVGSVTYNALRASDGAPGWAAMSVAGATTFDWPGVASADNPKELVTDWVNLRSVARADGGSRPLVMFRVQHNGTADGDWAGFTVTPWYTDGPAQQWYRLWQPHTISGGGGVTDPTKTASSLATSSLWCAVEFDYDSPAATVLGVGDSQQENSGGYATGTFGVWGHQACAAVSSMSRPVQFFNAARAGGTPSVYLPPGLQLIASMSPKVVFYQPISSNSGAVTAARVAAAMGEIAQIRAACAAVKSTLVLVTGIPFSSSATADAAADALRLQLTTHSATLAARGLCQHLDFEALLGTGASPNRIKAEFGADAGPTHITPAGQTLMAAQAAELLRRILPA
jgi:hypothetical protein